MKTRMIMMTALVCGAMVLAVTSRAAKLTQEAGVYGAYQDTDLLSEGWGVGLRYLLATKQIVPHVPELELGVDVRGNWLTDYDEDSDLYSAEAILTLGYDLGKGMMPYIGAGVGEYIWDSDSPDADDNTLAGNAVVGWDQTVYKNVSIFVEAKYLYGDDDLEGWGANAGINYRW